ncbi:MAG: Jag N-terminal domain-containing protein, partial [Anaerolineales bacterium]
MNQESRATLEVIAPTIEEAIEKGLKELGVTEDLVDIEVLDEGTKGLFGLGNRQARIRMTILGTQKGSPQPAAAPAETYAQPPEDHLDEEHEENDDDYEDDNNDEDQYDDYYGDLEGEFDLENVRAIASATVSELLEKMNIHRAMVEASFLPLDEDNNRPGILVEVTGNDLSILIGKQAETLNALQYVTRLIVGKEIGRGVNLIVDVEGYRSRREQNL